MKAHIELDISDVMEAIRKHIAEKHPKVEVDGVTVKTWNYTIFTVVEDKLQEWNHVVNPNRQKL